MRKPRHREVKSLVEGLRSGPWRSWCYSNVAAESLHYVGGNVSCLDPVDPGMERISLRFLPSCISRLNQSSSVIQSCLTLATPWTVAHQAFPSITNSQSLTNLMSIKSVMPSYHLILCYPLILPPSIFPASGFSPKTQFFSSAGQSIGASVSSSVLPMNIQD